MLKFGIISIIKAISTVRPAENECVFGRLRTFFQSFRRFRRVVTCYNCASSNAISSLLSAGKVSL